MGITSDITSAIANQTSGSNNAQTAGAGLASNFNTFLTLLTTQLKNQDPTNPVDSNQFTQQLVAFAGVQQQVQTNSLLQQQLAVSQASQVSSASAFVGTNIQAGGNQGALINGNAQFGYTLGSGAAKAQVTITDGAGHAVFSGTGSTSAGSNVVIWQGNNNLTGAPAPDGVYTMTVQATDANGRPVSATPFITGTVSSASINNGTVMLNIGALQIPASSVTSVTNLTGSPLPSSATQG